MRFCPEQIPKIYWCIKDLDFLKSHGTIATGSLRRQAQWLHKYPSHRVVDLRGNVNTRLQKLQDNPWNGAIFAKAGLERIEVLPPNHIDLDWMVPAPAQGAMVVVSMENDTFSTEAVRKLNDSTTDILHSCRKAVSTNIGRGLYSTHRGFGQHRTR